MARRHPEDIDGLEGPTEGERKVFRFLREATRPDQDFIGWYESTIGEQGREPDFVLFGKQLGLLALEVKDWLIDQIEEADPPTNPDRQAKYSIHRGETKDEEMKYFSTGGRYRRSKSPWSYEPPIHVYGWALPPGIFIALESLGRALIISPDFCSARRNSYSFCRFSQNSGLVLKKCPRRKAVSPVTFRWPFRISVMRLVGTLSLRANSAALMSKA